MYELTHIDKWYLKRCGKSLKCEKTLEEVSVNEEVSKKLLYRAKRIGFSDYQISKMLEENRDLCERFTRKLPY